MPASHQIIQRRAFDAEPDVCGAACSSNLPAGPAMAYAVLPDADACTASPTPTRAGACTPKPSSSKIPTVAMRWQSPKSKPSAGADTRRIQASLATNCAHITDCMRVCVCVCVLPAFCATERWFFFGRVFFFYKKIKSQNTAFMLMKLMATMSAPQKYSNKKAPPCSP